MMKKCLLFFCMLISGMAYAHESSTVMGDCFFVKKNNPQRITRCELNNGGGAGGTYTQLRLKERTVLIEEYQSGAISVGVNEDSLMDGRYYFRDYKTRKIISIDNARQKVSYTCAKQVYDTLDVCFIVDN